MCYSGCICCRSSSTGWCRSHRGCYNNVGDIYRLCYQCYINWCYCSVICIVVETVDLVIFLDIGVVIVAVVGTTVVLLVIIVLYVYC